MFSSCEDNDEGLPLDNNLETQVTNTNNNPEPEVTSGHTHIFGEPTYQWSEDYSICTATRVCQDDETHKQTETVNATCVVVTEPTNEEVHCNK